MTGAIIFQNFNICDIRLKSMGNFSVKLELLNSDRRFCKILTNINKRNIFFINEAFIFYNCVSPCFLKFFSLY
ncbi:hypothetical protein SMULJ23_1695 [Streptococcus mutans LJ23]|nr:hypothetical protein [Streptococcus mutans]BAH88715.1 hypothetical protein SmuNN2025_1689 [Streptococcus mutans NN2025]BAL70029.1 hypothetical protein SMULJ23_1695 [Streptococcus mutans LJ23]